MKLSEAQKKFCLLVAAVAVLLFAGSFLLVIVPGGSKKNEKKEEMLSAESVTGELTADRRDGSFREEPAKTAADADAAEDAADIWSDALPAGDISQAYKIEDKQSLLTSEGVLRDDEPADMELVAVISNDKDGLRLVGEDMAALRWETETNELVVVAKNVSTGRVNIFERPDAESARVGELPPLGAAKVDALVEDETGDWYHIRSGNVKGYSRAIFFVSGNEAYNLLSEEDRFWFKPEEGSSDGAEQVLLSFATAQPVHDIVQKETGFSSSHASITIKSVSGATAFVPQNFYASIHTQNTTQGMYKETGHLLEGVAWSKYSEASAERRALVDSAMSYVGGRYVWGGNDLNSGVDCSGYVKALYGKIGVSLPRCSYEQATAGRQVGITQVRPGDLVFYAKRGKVYHVAMYIGDGRIVHAKNAASGIVTGYMSGSEYCAISLLP